MWHRLLEAYVDSIEALLLVQWGAAAALASWFWRGRQAREGGRGAPATESPADLKAAMIAEIDEFLSEAEGSPRTEFGRILATEWRRANER